MPPAAQIHDNAVMYVDINGSKRKVVIALDPAVAPKAVANFKKLIGADLHSAKLTNAVLRHADLTRADLRGADLTDAELAVSVTTFPGVKLCRTKMPDGSINNRDCPR